MVFNSFEFAIFLPIVFAIYWLLNAHTRNQNLFIVIASYVFYGWWDWRFLSLIIISSLADYVIGLMMHKEQTSGKRKRLLIASLAINLGILGFFKYFDFFVQSFVDSFTFFGQPIQGFTLQIVLPVGISFYTFQTLSYSIDVYRKKLEPCQDMVSFFAFVSFFPQLVAGPIERATNLLPQFYKKRTFDLHQARDGLRQMLWGLFKKMVIADNCGIHVNHIFANYETLTGSELLLGAIYFAIQIYCDFSGYSDVAIGVSRLFGFNLMRNFAFPYFSRDIAEFWRRWHISLSTWFRDYLYIPLGGSRVSQGKVVRNVFAIFIVSGFWHGANWTFIIWGALNAIYFLPLLLSKKNRTYLDDPAQGRLFASFREVIQISGTFLLTCLAWVFFRAETVGHALAYLRNLFAMDFFSVPGYTNYLPLVGLLIIVEWLQRHKQHGLQLEGIAMPLRYFFYLVIIVFIIEGTADVEIPFIYFQF